MGDGNDSLSLSVAAASLAVGAQGSRIDLGAGDDTLNLSGAASGRELRSVAASSARGYGSWVSQARNRSRGFGWAQYANAFRFGSGWQRSGALQRSFGIAIGFSQSTLETGSGDDTVTLAVSGVERAVGSARSQIALGDGTDSLTLRAVVTSPSGPSQALAIDDSSIDVGAGSNFVQLEAVADSTLDATVAIAARNSSFFSQAGAGSVILNGTAAPRSSSLNLFVSSQGERAVAQGVRNSLLDMGNGGDDLIDITVQAGSSQSRAVGLECTTITTNDGHDFVGVSVDAQTALALSNAQINLGDGNDTCVIKGLSSSSRIDGGSGNDVLKVLSPVGQLSLATTRDQITGNTLFKLSSSCFSLDVTGIETLYWGSTSINLLSLVGAAERLAAASLVSRNLNGLSYRYSADPYANLNIFSISSQATGGSSQATGLRSSSVRLDVGTDLLDCVVQASGANATARDIVDSFISLGIDDDYLSVSSTAMGVSGQIVSSGVSGSAIDAGSGSNALSIVSQASGDRQTRTSSALAIGVERSRINLGVGSSSLNITVLADDNDRSEALGLDAVSLMASGQTLSGIC
jgi:hypothetical protein